MELDRPESAVVISSYTGYGSVVNVCDICAEQFSVARLGYFLKRLATKNWAPATIAGAFWATSLMSCCMSPFNNGRYEFEVFIWYLLKTSGNPAAVIVRQPS